MKLDKKETLRYLGYKGQILDDSITNLIDETANELENSIAPKSIYREFTCQVPDDSTIIIDSLLINSKNLAKNLKGCHKVILFAATLGPSIDMLIKRYSITNMAKASIIQAAGAALIETACDEAEEEIRLKYLSQRLYLRPRFSPGYGDFDLTYQNDIFNMLECTKRIGITLTQNCLMFPSKSVTALIGITSDSTRNCHREKCTNCNKSNCEYRS